MPGQPLTRGIRQMFGRTKLFPSAAALPVLLLRAVIQGAVLHCTIYYYAFIQNVSLYIEEAK